MADYLTAPDLIARMDEHQERRRRGLGHETRISCVEPVVVPKHSRVTVPEALLMQGGYGTQEQLFDYLRQVNGVPSGAEVLVDVEIASRARYVTFQWWEVETWEPKNP